MTAVNPPGQPAYTANPVLNPTTNAVVVDANDLVVPTGVQMDLAPPANAGGYQGVPMQVLTALLVEARVFTNLLAAQIGSGFDIVAMRADESDGASGGSI